MHTRKQIAVLFGGCSPEYQVSLQSAYAVISHMDREQYDPLLIGITRQGDWLAYEGSLEHIADDTWHRSPLCRPAAVSPSRSEHAILTWEEGQVRTHPIDAAFPILHGQNGEDGTVQGLFELAGIPLVGCGTLSSALCMDKIRAHRLVQAAGIPVALSFVLEHGSDRDAALTQAQALGYPLFVKPVRAGSSFGVTKVWTPDALPAAVQAAFAYDQSVLLEEIELADGFFDYTEKYTLKTSAIHVPARISAADAQRVKQAARTIYRALDCRGFARVDLFFSDGGRIVFNEVNTIPGFTAHSRFPNMLKAAGFSFEQIVSRAITLAVGP